MIETERGREGERVERGMEGGRERERKRERELVPELENFILHGL